MRIATFQPLADGRYQAMESSGYALNYVCLYFCTYESSVPHQFAFVQVDWLSGLGAMA